MTVHSIALDDQTAERLSRLSAERGQTPGELLSDALLLFDEGNGLPHVWSDQDDEDMRLAIAQADRGELIPHAQVMAEARVIVAGGR